MHVRVHACMHVVGLCSSPVICAAGRMLSTCIVLIPADSIGFEAMRTRSQTAASSTAEALYATSSKAVDRCAYCCRRLKWRRHKRRLPRTHAHSAMSMPLSKNMLTTATPAASAGNDSNTQGRVCLHRTFELETAAKQKVQFGCVAAPATPLPAQSCPDASKVAKPDATAARGWFEPVPQLQRLPEQKALGPTAVPGGRRPKMTPEAATPAKRQRTAQAAGSMLDQLLSEVQSPGFNGQASPLLQQLLTPPQSEPRRRRLVLLTLMLVAASILLFYDFYPEATSICPACKAGHHTHLRRYEAESRLWFWCRAWATSAHSRRTKCWISHAWASAPSSMTHQHPAEGKLRHASQYGSTWAICKTALPSRPSA